MTDILLYIAASLDGYIATLDGGIEWLSSFEGSGEDYGYAEFYDSLDALVMGRKSYEQVLTFGEWPYPGKMSFVFTQRDLGSEREDLRIVSGDPTEEMKQIAEQGFERVWLMGGAALIASFRQAHLIDEYIISTIPVLLGEGIPLFEPPGVEEQVTLVSAKEYPSGVVQTRYKSVR